MMLKQLSNRRNRYWSRTLALLLAMTLGLSVIEPTLAQARTLDTNFGDDDIVTTNLRRSEEVQAIAIDSNGRILVAGHSIVEKK